MDYELEMEMVMSGDPSMKFFNSGWILIHRGYMVDNILPVVSFTPSKELTTRELYERYDFEAGMRSFAHRVHQNEEGLLV